MTECFINLTGENIDKEHLCYYYTPHYIEKGQVYYRNNDIALNLIALDSAQKTKNSALYF